MAYDSFDFVDLIVQLRISGAGLQSRQFWPRVLSPTRTGLAIVFTYRLKEP
jgi:hypothetical protein